MNDIVKLPAYKKTTVWCKILDILYKPSYSQLFFKIINFRYHDNKGWSGKKEHR